MRWRTLEKYFEQKTKNIFKPLDRRTNTIKSYWDLYTKSGIFKAIGKHIRTKYEIPHLDSKVDHIFYTKAINDYDDVELDDFVWLHESGLEKAIHKEIRYYLKVLSLPINASDSLKYWILYDENLGMYPTFGIIDLIFDITLGTHYADEYMGYTPKEIEYLIHEATEMVKTMDWLTTENDKGKFLNHFISKINKYKRKKRPLSDVEKKAKIIRLYGKKKTSQDIAQSIVGDIDLPIKKANKEAAAIRKQMERIYKELPFLKDILK